MATRLATATRNAMANAAVDLIDAGGGAGKVLIRTSVPADVNDADSGTLLGTLTFSATAFGNASAGVATASAITSDTSADNSGTAACGRVKDFANAILMDGAAAAGSGEFNFDNATIVAGGTIAISAMTFTQPAS